MLSLLLFSVTSFLAPADSITTPKEKPFGSILRTVREMEMTGDTTLEILQIETTKAKAFGNIVVRFGIYTNKGKLLFRDTWNASDYFDPNDKVADTIKWRRLQRILRGYFVNHNFSSDSDEMLASIFERSQPVDIQLNSPEEKEFTASPHRVFSIFAGRDKLYAITWLESKKRFVKLWQN